MGSSDSYIRLRELREKRGLTQEQLAVAAGVTAKTVANIENGRSAIPLKGTLRLLADALGVEPDDLTEPEQVAA